MFSKETICQNMYDPAAARMRSMVKRQLQAANPHDHDPRFYDYTTYTLKRASVPLSD